MHSLKKAGEHNGKQGVLQGYDGEAGRWIAELKVEVHVLVRVLTANLTSLSADDKCPAGSAAW